MRCVGYRGATMEIPSIQQLNSGWMGFDRLYGFDLVEISDTEVRAKVEVRDESGSRRSDPRRRVRVGGGVDGFVGDRAGVFEEGESAMGLSNNTSFCVPSPRGSSMRTPADA